MSKLAGIYGLHCTVTDKWYVGQSRNIHQRWQSYRPSETGPWKPKIVNLQVFTVNLPTRPD